MTAAAPNPTFIPRLESIRGIAAWLVALFHAAQATYAPGHPLLGGAPDWDAAGWGAVWRLYVALFCNGHGAVIVFFVLSGFVLALSLSREGALTVRSAAGFLLGRVLRLYPAVFAAVPLFALALWLAGRDVGFGQIVRNMLLVAVDLNGVMWSLQVELLAGPFILLAVAVLRRWGVAALAALTLLLLGLSFAKGWRLPGVDGFGLVFCFLVGVLVQAVTRAAAGRGGDRGRFGLALVSVAAFCAARPLLGFASHWSVVVEALAAAGLIGAIAGGACPGFDRVLNSPVARFYGRISYSFYLLHPLTLLVVWSIPGPLSAALAAGVPGPVLALVLGVGSALAVTPLAWLSWRFVELPAVALSRRWRGRGGSRPTAAATAFPLAPARSRHYLVGTRQTTEPP
ncbi:acyltransferase family protein [Rhodoplanes serenus]|uniref:acyltransferase family protein n=1 Tax=Rhodoplanes serenus TaxID=200615 RepID=UPI000DACC820|nr:acyltransferase [Rhodoplanes serenus]RAI32306.1 hypothetical protein CH340_15895 [Rhodoplanes serenus]